MPGDFRGASAILCRGVNTAWVFREPEQVIRGNIRDISHFQDEWAKKCASIRQVPVDSGLPPGAAVGYFTYEGDFEFSFFECVEKIPLETLEIKAGNFSSESREEDWVDSLPRSEYEKAVSIVREYIAAGDIYQANICRCLHRVIRDLDGLELFRHLWSRTHAPHSAYLRLGQREIMSASPESFITISGRAISTQPVKGTRPRGKNPAEDERLARELASDPKEIAELIMITDLERNDLGRICEYGSVEVLDLVKQQAYSHVHHQYSTVRGKLRADVTPLAAVVECLPGGSITGAPKLRAMEIIREVERQPRGLYTGAIGCFGYDGTADFSIAIRTFEYTEGELSFGVGSGITWDSIPTLEFQETQHKARAMLEAFASYEK